MKRLLYALFLFCITMRPYAQITSQGPLEPSVVTEQYAGCLACPGTDWMNTSNAELMDSLYAEVPLFAYGFCFQASCYYSRALLPHEYGFAIPSNATILGIRADVLRKGNTLNSIIDTLVELYTGGAAVGLNKSSPYFWPDTAAWISYGDSTDLWGINWLPSDINAVDFGIYFRPMNKSASGNSRAYVDNIRITVWYQTGTGILAHQTSFLPFQLLYNPTLKALHINNTSESGSAILEIISGNGKLLFSENISPSDNESIRIDLSAGIYIARILQRENYLIKKFIVD